MFLNKLSREMTVAEPVEALVISLECDRFGLYFDKLSNRLNDRI